MAEHHVQHHEETVEGVKIDKTGDKNMSRNYGEGDMEVVFRRGNWKNWDDAIHWLENNGEADNELTPGQTLGLTEDLRRLRDSGAKFTNKPDEVYRMAHHDGSSSHQHAAHGTDKGSSDSGEKTSSEHQPADGRAHDRS